MARAQIPQMFIFLMAILVIGTTIFVGVKLFGWLDQSACDASQVDFTSQLGEVLDANSQYGSRQRVSIPAPCDAVALCFVNSTVADPSAFRGNDSVISTSVKNGVRTNIFIQLRGTTQPAGGGGYDQRIVLPEQYEDRDLCILAKSGKFSFATRGYGRTVEIS